MPRVLDPSSLSRGGGLAASRSVEATSFVNPTQGLDTTIAHIVDPSRAHMARAIGVVDVAGNFTSDHVEGALAELAAGHGDTNQNGVFQGCGYTAVGLVVTLDTPSLVLVNGTERTMSGETITLTNGTTNWLFVHGTTGVLSKQVGLPSITSPEHILLAKIVTAAGAITTSQDARWFVRNIERKLPFTVRASGTAADRNSEAAFETIDAALLYLSNFGGGVIRNATLVIKGPLTIAASLVIPTNGVTLQGEGGCVLSTGAVLTPMIDISSRTGIRIRDISFSCENAGSTAISCPSSGALSDMVIERCIFKSGAADWNTAVNFDFAGPQSKVVIRDCNITATTYGVRIREPKDCRLIDTTITEIGGAGTIGFHLGRVGGAIGTAADSVAHGIRVNGFGTGAFLRGVRMQADACTLIDSDTGIVLGPNATDMEVDGCTVLLDATNGLIGVDVLATRVRVSGCRISNQKAGGAYVAEVPIGIHVQTNSDYVSVDGTHIDGFLNTTSSLGHGILTDANSVDFVVDGCTITTAHQGITTNSGTNVLVSGTSTRDTDVGMVIAGTGNTITGCNVVSSSTRGVGGVQVDGADTVITGCTITCIRAAFAGETPIGIVSSTGTLTVSNCLVRGWRNAGGSLGAGVKLFAGSAQVAVKTTTFVACWIGVQSPNAVAADEVTISECTFRSTDTYAVFLDNSNQVHISGCTAINGNTSAAFHVANGTDIEVIGCKVFGNSTTPIGIHIVGTDTVANRVRRFLVSNCNITEVTADGILLDGYVQNGVVSGNHVDCFLPGAPSDPTALACIRLASGGTTDLIKHVEVVGNTCWRAKNGILIVGVDASTFAADISVSNNTVHHCAVGSGGTTACSGVVATFVQNLTVTGNSISSIGKLISNLDVSTSPTAGANVYPYGIQVLNSTQMQIGSNAVTDCVANGAGTVTGISVNVTGAGVVFAMRAIAITGNRVVTTDAIAAQSVGIVVQCGDGVFASTVLGLVISGNTVRRTNLIGITVLSNSLCSMQQVVVSGNTVSQCLDGTLGQGFRIGAVTGVLREVEIIGNNVGDTGNSGIHVFSTNAASLTSVSIRDNVIADTGDRGIAIVGATLPVAFTGFVMSNNTITGAANEGLYFSVTDFSVTTLSICGNTVFGANGGLALGTGIYVEAVAAGVAQANLTRITVSGNRIHTSNSNGIHFDVDGTLLQSVFSGNVVDVNSGFGAGVVLTLNSPATVLAQAYSGEIVVSGNTFTGGGGGTLLVVDHGQKLRNFTFSDNTCQATLLGIQLSMANGTVGADEAVTGFLVQGNTFDATTSQGVRLLLGDLVTAIDTCAGISVTGNTFRNCNTVGVDNGVVYVRCFCLLQNLTISQNEFKTVGTLDSIASGNIWVQLGTGAGASADNIVVSENSFMSCSGIAVLVEDQPTGTAAWTLINLKVDGNSIKTQTNDAIRLDLAAFTVANCISVNGNNITNVSGAASDTGIIVLGPTSADLNQLAICQNILRSTGNGATGAILLTALGDLNGLVIDGNSISGDAATLASIRVTMNNPGAGTNTWDGGSCSGNTVNTSAGSVAGICLQSTGSGGAAGIKNIVVSGNQVFNATADGILVQGVHSTSDATLSNITLNGNVTDVSGGYGLRVDGYSLANITVSGNAVRNSTLDGIHVDTVTGVSGTDLNAVTISGNDIRAGSGNGLVVSSDGDIFGLNISGNVLTAIDDYGIYVVANGGGAAGAGDAHSLSITGNTLYNWNSTNGALYGVYLQVTDAKSVVIDSNNLQSTNPGSVGFSFIVVGLVRGFNIQDNTVVMDGAGGGATQSLSFNAGGGGTQISMSFIGNSFRGVDTGVTGSVSFAPDRSICAYNNERRNGPAAGAWAAFEALFTNSLATGLNQN